MRCVVLVPLLLAACGAPAPSRLAGKSADDAVTAHLRAVFANGDTPTVAAAVPQLTGKTWSCSYHATTDQIVMVGQTDVTYASTFAPNAAGDRLLETVATVAAGDLALPGWSGSFRFTQAGLRSDGAGFTELVRTIDGDDGQEVGVEFLYAAAPGDERGDPGIGSPTLRTAGLAICTSR